MHAIATSESIKVSAELQEKVLLGGDLSKLAPSERLSYYNAVCTSLGLNPLTRPFEYIVLNGKLTLYARKDCTEQLRAKRVISVRILSRELTDDVYVVTAEASEPATPAAQAYALGPRSDVSIGAVSIANLQGEAKANAMMKAETKAKRRVTLSICGLGMMDETEVETIPGTKIVSESAGVACDVHPVQSHPSPNSEAEPSGIVCDFIAKIDDLQDVLTAQRTWDEIVKCQDVTSKQRAGLFKRYQDKVKSLK